MDRLDKGKTEIWNKHPGRFIFEDLRYMDSRTNSKYKSQYGSRTNSHCVKLNYGIFKETQFNSKVIRQMAQLSDPVELWFCLVS